MVAKFGEGGGAYEAPRTPRQWIDAALEKLAGQEDEQIREENFVDLYGEETIRSDRSYVERMREQFVQDAAIEGNDREGFELAKVLEGIINHQLEQNEWMGPEVTTRQASDYDDIANGVDMIAEMEHSDATQHLAIALDATYGIHLEKKMERIRNEINEGTLTAVKYFEDSEGNFRGELKRVPRVVVGADHDTILNLIQLWVENKNKELASHPIQLQILDEVYMQLKIFAQYAEKVDQPEVVKIYQRQARIVKRIMADKKELREKVGTAYERDDRVFKEIQKRTLSFDQ